ncbi:MAG TPA: RNA polymerase sigma factor, partial [Myxococcales bacterium]|nr:RNA polymerase sigma factor [Myxococcales bacterium]
MTKGDRARFETFVRGSRAAMVRIARNLSRAAAALDPEDLVEETLERALRQLERGAGPDPLTLAFATTVMTNRYIDLCRKRRSEAAAVPPPEPEPEEEHSEERWRGVGDEQLVKAIQALQPPRVREAYQLHAQGMRYRQIAERLHVPEGTVGSDLSEARKQLRRMLAGGGGDEQG